MAIVTPPVVGLTLNEPVKPADAVTVKLEIVPLSVGGAEGVTVAPAPVLIGPVAGYVPSVGAVFAVTLTVSVALAVALLASVTVKLKTEVVAPHAALRLAVTLPAASIKTLEIVTPAPATGVMLTVKELAGWSASETVAIWELVAALPCCRVSGPAAVIVGGALTVNVKVALVVAPQLSVVVTVTV